VFMDEITRGNIRALVAEGSDLLDSETGHDNQYVVEHLLARLEGLAEVPAASRCYTLAFDDHGNLL
jgi:hypothetical protein